MYYIIMINLIVTYHLFFALLLLVLASFIAFPAMRRLSRNIYLVRKGSVATGHYLSARRAVFFCDGGKKRIEFSTLHKFRGQRREIEVLYNPKQLSQAEVRSAGILWIKPIDAIAQALGVLATASAFMLQVNDALAIGLGILCVLILWLFVRILFVGILILSVKYPLFHGAGKYIFVDFKPKMARKPPVEKEMI